MNTKTKQSNRNTGFVLVLVLFTTLILATLVIGLLNVTAIDAKLAHNYISSEKAYYVAEAGIADALGKLQTDGKGAYSWINNDFEGKLYDIAVTDTSPVTITSVGTDPVSGFTRKLEVTAEVTGGAAPYDVSVVQWKEI